MWLYSIRKKTSFPQVIDIYACFVKKFTFVLCYGYDSMNFGYPSKAEYNMYIRCGGSWFPYNLSIPYFWFRFLFGIGRESLWLPHYDEFNFIERLYVVVSMSYAYIIHNRHRVRLMLFNHCGI